LCEIGPVEVLKPALLSQAGAHSILTWLDTLDMQGAYQALRTVHALGKSDEEYEPIAHFMDFVSGNTDFETGRYFWTNVYKVWLSHMAIAVQHDFQQKMKGIIYEFNALHGKDRLRATYRLAAPKTYDRLKQKELEFGTPDALTHGGRFVARNILDLVRCTVSVNCPRAAVVLLNDFFRPLSISKNRLQLVRIENRFHEDAQVASGCCRDLSLNIHYDGGNRKVNVKEDDAYLSLVGEVKVVMEDFASVLDRSNLIQKYSAGEFDHKQSQEEGRTLVGSREPSPLPQ